jgi:hypothetical protein
MSSSQKKNKRQQEQEEQEEIIINLCRKLGAVTKQVKKLSDKIQFTPIPRLVNDYLTIKKSMVDSIALVNNNAQAKDSYHRESPYYADYDFDNSTIHDSAKKFLDDLDATYKPQHEAYLAKVALMRAEHSKLCEEEDTLSKAVKAIYAEQARRDEELREKKRVKKAAKEEAIIAIIAMAKK